MCEAPLYLRRNLITLGAAGPTHAPPHTLLQFFVGRLFLISEVPLYFRRNLSTLGEAGPTHALPHMPRAPRPPRSSWLSSCRPVLGFRVQGLGFRV